MLENKTFDSVTINIFIDIKVNFTESEYRILKNTYFKQKVSESFLPFSQSPKILIQVCPVPSK